MNKIAKLVHNHLRGKKTAESTKLMNKIAQNLENEGFEPPFQMEVKKERLYPNGRLDPTTRNMLNDDIRNLITPDNKTIYFDAIPLQDLIEILKGQGLLILQEDNTPWDGFLLGRDSSAVFPIAAFESAKDEGSWTSYEPLKNATLALQWYKMPESGRYEINAYV